MLDQEKSSQLRYINSKCFAFQSMKRCGQLETINENEDFLCLFFSSPEEQCFILDLNSFPKKQYSHYCRLSQKYFIFCMTIF